MKRWHFTRARRPGPQQDARFEGFGPSVEWLAEVRALDRLRDEESHVTADDIKESLEILYAMQAEGRA